jgi:hypothetical protein
MDDATNDPADVRLTNALLRLKVKGNKTDSFSLGPLHGHALLFPELFQTTSLGLLGSLFQRSWIGATRSTLPGFQVHFGAGRFRERSLFLFFDSVLQFQDREHFSQVLDQGTASDYNRMRSLTQSVSCTNFLVELADMLNLRFAVG